MYTIRVYYSTGDSFDSYDTTDDIGMTWKNLEVAKSALKRIKEHAIWLRDKDSYHKKPKQPLWLNAPGYSINLLDDNGDEKITGAFWEGYFENLISADIVVDEDDEMSFTL